MMKTSVVCVMGKGFWDWVDDNGRHYVLFKDREHSSPDSEDEVGRYKSRYFSQGFEFQDVSPENMDPYMMELQLIEGRMA